MVLIYIADAIWIVALSIIASASRQAGRKMAPETRVPIQVRAGGKAARRAPRNLALAGPPVAATVIGVVLLVAARQAESADAQLILFGVRLFTASVLPLAHMLWLTAAMRTLAEEGSLKP